MSDHEWPQVTTSNKKFFKKNKKKWGKNGKGYIYFELTPYFYKRPLANKRPRALQRLFSELYILENSK